MRVKLISPHGQAGLIEYQDNGATKRGYLPIIELTRQPGREYQAGEYDVARPEHAAPYGLPWADLVTISATPQTIEDALHQYGIWTADDLERHHIQAQAAIVSIIAPDLMNLIRAARGYESDKASR